MGLSLRSTVLCAAPRELPIPEVWESAWAETPRAAMRLIAGGRLKANSDATHLRAGIELKLPAGFKTYWRDPGNSGVPPVFDWTGSENVAKVDVLWPAPKRFFDGLGQSIGYGTSIVFPLLITPKDASSPVVLALKMHYAVCDMLCIPAEGAARLPLPTSGTGPHEAMLSHFEAAVPRRQAIGADKSTTIIAAKLKAADPPILAVEAFVPKGATGISVFAEGPTGFYFGDPVIVSREPKGERERLLFHLPIEERPKDAKRFTAKLTLATNSGAIECETDLDGLASKR